MPPTARDVSGWLVGLLVGAVIVERYWRVGDPALGDPQRRWAVVATIAVAVAVAHALPRAQRLMPAPGVLPSLIGTSLIAIYGCVPETSHIGRVAAIAFVVVLLEVRLRRPLPIVVHHLLAALVLWAGIFGATGQERAIVGTLFAFWPVIIVPFAAAIAPALRRSPAIVRLAIAGVGAVSAVIVARTGALEPNLRPALVAVAICGGASLLAALVVGPISGKGKPPLHR